MACFLNLDLEPSHLVDFQVACSALKVELWLPLVLASVLHLPLVNITVSCICFPCGFLCRVPFALLLHVNSLSQVPLGSVHHSPFTRLLLGGPYLAVRLHLVPLLHLEELQPLEAPLKEAWSLVHPAG